MSHIKPSRRSSLSTRRSLPSSSPARRLSLFPAQNNSVVFDEQQLEQLPWKNDSKRARAIRTTFNKLVQDLFDVDHSGVLLSTLPNEVVSKHGLQIQQYYNKAIESIKENISNEYDVIVGEHNLLKKLGQIETLETNNEIGTYRSLLSTPEVMMKFILLESRRAEKQRLLEEARALDDENAALRSHLTALVSESQPMLEAFQQKQHVIEQIYNTLKQE